MLFLMLTVADFPDSPEQSGKKKDMINEWSNEDTGRYIACFLSKISVFPGGRRKEVLIVF